jgi:hypothetical protein
MQIEGQTCYTAAETAERLGISPNTLRRQRTSGRIQGIAIGRDYVYSATEIRRYQIEVQQPAGARSRAGRPARPPRDEPLARDRSGGTRQAVRRDRGARGEADRPAREPDPAPYRSIEAFMQDVAANGGQVPGSTYTLEMDV